MFIIKIEFYEKLGFPSRGPVYNILYMVMHCVAICLHVLLLYEVPTVVAYVSMLTVAALCMMVYIV